MKKTAEISNPAKFGCEFCKREFVRERTLVSHICEYKQRWLSKDSKGSRLGFQSWLQFYAKNSMSKTKNKTVEEFIRSPYYIAFVKFGTYCSDVNVINVSRYVDWLLKDNIKIDEWNSDKNYTRFLCEYLRFEDPYDAIKRGVEFCIELATEEKIQPEDCLRYANKNKLCYAITTGKISPWMLYQSDSGKEFLDRLHEDQVRMVFDYINPELWNIKFKREPGLVDQIKDLLKQARY